MQALILDANLAYRRDCPVPEPGGDEALIRVGVAGICATDLELVRGYAGFSGIIGHEFVGRVEAVGNGRYRDWLGRRVVGSINIGCQACPVCREQGPEHCLQRKVLGIRGRNGVFADYFTLPIRNLFEVPDRVDDEQAVFAEPLAAALRVVQQLADSAIGSLAVIGPGRLGLLIAKVLADAGRRVTVLGRTETSLALPRQWQLASGLIQDADDNSFDGVVDASGQADGFRQALRILRPRGTLILKSTFSSLEPVDLSKVVVGEIRVLGSRCGPFAEALATLQRKTVPVETLIDGRYPLSAGIDALEHAARPGVRKILLRP